MNCDVELPKKPEVVYAEVVGSHDYWFTIGPKGDFMGTQFGKGVLADDIGQTTLYDLAPSQLVLLEPIPVAVEFDDESWVVSFAEANVNASGETFQEAIEMLKEMIAFDYAFFGDSESVLGSGPKNQLAVLRRYVRS